MVPDSTNDSLEATTRELLETLREIESAVERPDPRRLIRPPTPRGLLEFTSEVGIPAAILVLRTNIAALELLQRTLRMMDDRAPQTDSSQSMRDRASTVTASSLARLEDVLDDLGTAIDTRSTDRTPDDLLAEARAQTEQLEAQLAAIEETDARNPATHGSFTEVDVDAEIESLRQSVETDDDGTADGGAADDGTQ